MVDQLPAVEHVFALTLEPGERQDIDSLRALLLDALRGLRGRSRRMRDRDFVLWFGEHQSRAGHFVSIGHPDHFDSDVSIHLQRALRAAGHRFRDHGRTIVSDIGAEPLLRWNFDEIIAYTDPFSLSSGRFGPDVVERSYDLSSHRPTRSARTLLPPAEFVLDPLHTLESWESNRAKIIGLIGEMIGAVSYTSLKKFMRGHCGIDVVEEPDADFPRYGLLTSGILGEDGGTVTARIRSGLPTALKYVVLAHELSHFVLHYPLLYLNQLVEQLSWSFPVHADRYRQLMGIHLDPAHVEMDANYFASYLLIPQWCDGDFASVILEGGVQPTRDEIAWRFLQSLFPHTSGMQVSWQNLDAIRARARHEISTLPDLNSADYGTLYQTMARAVIGRDGPHLDSVRTAVTVGICRCLDMWPDVRELNDMDWESDNTAQDPRVEEPRTEITVTRVTLPPLESGASRDPLVPLIPRTGSRRSMDSNLWQHALAGSDSPVRTVREWRERFPRSSVVLYPYSRSET